MSFLTCAPQLGAKAKTCTVEVLDEAMRGVSGDEEVSDGVLRMLQKISDLRGALGGGKDQGIVDPPFEGGVYVSALAARLAEPLPVHLSSPHSNYPASLCGYVRRRC